MDLTNIIEKIIKLRINDIIKKSELDEKTENKIREINENIAKNNKQNRKIIKTTKIEKKDRKIIAYTVYIKDANNIIKNNPTINYLPQKNITQINKVKHEKDNKNRMKELSKIWKNIDDLTINKYKDLTKDKN